MPKMSRPKRRPETTGPEHDTARRDARIAARVNERAPRATKRRSIPLPGYGPATAGEDTRRVFAQAEIMRLSREDQIRFAEALIKPPRPNGRLKRAAKPSLAAQAQAKSRFAIEPLSKAHASSRYNCGNDRLYAYFREIVAQDVKRKHASCFVARELATGTVTGFYTLSSSNVALTRLPQALARQLPHYPTVPAVTIGWLGRHGDFGGCRLGAQLLFDAIQRVATGCLGARAIFAEAIDEKNAGFYQAFGFTPLPSRPRTLFLPIATAWPR